MEPNSKPKIVSTTGNGIKEGALRSFEASLLGEVLHPSEERYQLARWAWNGRLDARRPGMVVRCAATVDVMRSVDFARGNGLAIAVRAGGHSMAGDSFYDAGMVIDVSPMKAIRVDRERRVASAEAGLTVGEFDQATLAMGLATVLGECMRLELPATPWAADSTD
jgi:FAD/FMN-containing dehydrogenase